MFLGLTTFFVFLSFFVDFVVRFQTSFQHFLSANYFAEYHNYSVSNDFSSSKVSQLPGIALFEMNISLKLSHFRFSSYEDLILSMVSKCSIISGLTIKMSDSFPSHFEKLFESGNCVLAT
eukprot:TRINITY_DN13736_c0_g1_i1.p1 TRINITY_DN13736_c0_g1~~TRINITY_DN13736_c0_g1_i1.p1  ORF type:complete len:120 (-),score=7.76 TRINITY_DN13736_c0_g1_i1:589-948(-)